MFRRYSYIFIISWILAGLAWWSNRVEENHPASQGRGGVEAKSGSVASQLEMLESLDRVIAYEHYYRSVYGHYTKILGRVGVSLPQSLSTRFEIRVNEASKNRVLVTAFSEVNGKTLDFASIDQDYDLHTNFPIPIPRADYLRSKAFKHLRVLKEARGGQVSDEQGIFKGYFRYEVQRNSSDHRIASAIGIRAPVEGMVLEMGPQGSGEISSLSQGMPWASSEPLLGLQARMNPNETGENHSAPAIQKNTLEEAYLAQRIFYGEMGRYAKSWNELSRITQFRFDAKNEYKNEEVPFGDNRGVGEFDAADAGSVNISSMRTPSSAAGLGDGSAPSQNSSQGQADALEIEAIREK